MNINARTTERPPPGVRWWSAALLAVVLAGCGGSASREAPRVTAERACTSALTAITDQLDRRITVDVFSQRMDAANVTAGEATKRDRRYATLVVGTEQARVEVVQGVKAGPWVSALLEDCKQV